MLKVKKTSKVTSQQMLKMASNLREKTGKASNIEINAWHFSSGHVEMKYKIYICDDVHNEDYESWKELQQAYFTLMEE